MHGKHPSHEETNENILRLRSQIDELTQRQAEALQSAIFVGMSPEQARQYDERRAKISALVDQLSTLQKSI